MAQRIEYKGTGDAPATLVPETHQEVLEAVKAMSQNQKEIVEALNRDFNELKRTVKEHGEKYDGLVESKIARLQEAIATRQEELDKLNAKTAKRMDDLDLAIQRRSRAGEMDEKEASQLMKEARQFQHQLNVIQKKANQRVTEVNVEQYQAYTKAFEEMLRTNPNQAGISPELMKTLTVGSDVDGGILVPPTYSNRMVERIWEQDIMRQLATIVTIGTDSYEFMEDNDYATDGWESETVANSATETPGLNRKNIPVHIQSARPRATQKLLDDSSINVEQWLADKVAKRMARTEGTSFITGTGINQPRGFLTYSTYANSTGTNLFTWGQLEYVPTGDSIVTASGIITLYYHLIEEFQARSTWLMNRLTLMKIMLMVDSAGRPLWQPAAGAGISNGAPSTLLGAPVRMSISMPSVAANAYPIAVGDFGEAYTIVDRQGITVQRDPYTVKPLVEFYTRRRVGGDVANFQAIKLQKVATS